MGDLVFRNANATQKYEHGKLSENWKGPYIISEDCGNGTYKLKTSNGEPLRHKWNIIMLKKILCIEVKHICNHSFVNKVKRFNVYNHFSNNYVIVYIKIYVKQIINGMIKKEQVEKS